MNKAMIAMLRPFITRDTVKATIDFITEKALQAEAQTELQEKEQQVALMIFAGETAVNQRELFASVCAIRTNDKGETIINRQIETFEVKDKVHELLKHL